MLHTDPVLRLFALEAPLKLVSEIYFAKNLLSIKTQRNMDKLLKTYWQQCFRESEGRLGLAAFQDGEWKRVGCLCLV